MDPRRSVELQAELHVPRDAVYPLIATQEGLATWLDEATFTPDVGAPVRLRLGEIVAVGTVLAIDPPQHVSLSLDWEGDPLGVPSVLALDAIDHGERTHLTLRHIGIPPGQRRADADNLWHRWFARLREAATRGAAAR